MNKLNLNTLTLAYLHFALPSSIESFELKSHKINLLSAEDDQIIFGLWQDISTLVILINIFLLLSYVLQGLNKVLSAT